MWGVSGVSSSSSSSSGGSGGSGGRGGGGFEKRGGSEREDRSTSSGKRSKNQTTVSNPKLIQPIFYLGGTTTLEKIQKTVLFLNELELKPMVQFMRYINKDQRKRFQIQLVICDLIVNSESFAIVEFYDGRYNPDKPFSRQQAVLSVDFARVDNTDNSAWVAIEIRSNEIGKPTTAGFQMIEIAYNDYFNDPEMQVDNSRHLPVINGVFPDSGLRMMDVANDMLRYAIYLPGTRSFYPTSKLNLATEFPIRSQSIASQLTAAFGFLVHLFTRRPAIEFTNADADTESGVDKKTVEFSSTTQVKLSCTIGALRKVLFNVILDGYYLTEAQGLTGQRGLRPGLIDVLKNSGDKDFADRFLYHEPDTVYLSLTVEYDLVESMAVELQWTENDGNWEMENVLHTMMQTPPVSYLYRELQRARHATYTGPKGMQVLASMREGGQRSSEFHILRYLIGDETEQDVDYETEHDEPLLRRAKDEFQDRQWKCKNAVFNHVQRVIKARESLFQQYNAELSSFESVMGVVHTMHESVEQIGNGLID